MRCHVCLAGGFYDANGGREARVQADLKLLPEGTKTNNSKGEIQLRWRDHTQLLTYMEMVRGKTALENLLKTGWELI